MEVYLVGGAVRDTLLGRPVSDRDYVVVGASPEDLILRGFKQVGADFPVFLHPESGEEYALARTERKSGTGYHGFSCDFSPSVTLEDDLARRDLTVNAMAMNRDGEVIDPFGGMEDLKNRTFRDLGLSFQEDPLRILRVARFMARHIHEGWTIDPVTLYQMSSVARSGELRHLTPERVWKELSRALLEPTPSAFIGVLHACGALQEVLPEVDALFGVPQPEEHHPEIDTGIHTMLVMDQAAKLSDRLEVRFGAMVHDLGKGTTPKEELPRHLAHEHRGVEIVEALAQRLKIPNAVAAAGVHASKHHLRIHTCMDSKAKTLVKFFDSLNFTKKPHQLEDLLLISEADARGRTGFGDRDYPQADFVRHIAKASLDVDTKAISAKFSEPGPKIGQAIYEARVHAAKAALNAYKNKHQNPGRATASGIIDQTYSF